VVLPPVEEGGLADDEDEPLPGLAGSAALEPGRAAPAPDTGLVGIGAAGDFGTADPVAGVVILDMGWSS
jgi:hypothetical protein